MYEKYSIRCEKCGGFVRRRMIFMQEKDQRMMVVQPYCTNCGSFKSYNVDMTLADMMKFKKRANMVVRTGIELGHIVKKGNELVQRS